MALALGDNVNQLQFVILLGIVLGVYWAVASNLTVQKLHRNNRRRRIW